MADASISLTLPPPSTWLSKLFLTEDGADINLEAIPPSDGRTSTLAIVAVTDSGPVLLKSVTGRSRLCLSIPRDLVPAESLDGSGRFASLSEPGDTSRPGIYAVLWVGGDIAGSRVLEEWSRTATNTTQPPIGASLKVLSGAQLVPGDVAWPISSMGVELFWVVSSASTSRMAMAVIRPGAPTSVDIAYLVRRGRLAAVVAPTWTLTPGGPCLGSADLSQLLEEPGESVTVRRFQANETESVSVEVDEQVGSSPLVEELPSPMTIQGIEYTSVEAQWRADGSFMLTAL